MDASFPEAARHLHRRLGGLLAAPLLHHDADALDALRTALEIREGAETLVAAAVREARQAGRTWQQVGEVLGVSRQAAFQRYGKPIDPRTGAEMNTRPLPDAAELAASVIADLAHARWPEVSARFDATMRDRLTDEGIGEAWAHLVGLAGAFEGHGDTSIRRAGDFTTTSTPLAFEAGDFEARITFRDDRTIAGLYLLDADPPACTSGSVGSA